MGKAKALIGGVAVLVVVVLCVMCVGGCVMRRRNKSRGVGAADVPTNTV